MESIATAKADYLSRPQETQDPYLRNLLRMDMGPYAFTMQTQYFSSMAPYAYTPDRKSSCKMPEHFGSMLAGTHEIMPNIHKSLNFW